MKYLQVMKTSWKIFRSDVL